jgi:hypothetical protein
MRGSVNAISKSWIRLNTRCYLEGIHGDGPKELNHADGFEILGFSVSRCHLASFGFREPDLDHSTKHKVDLPLDQDKFPDLPFPITPT